MADIKGYRYADGVHWRWNDMEVAVIDESTNEIEWVVRKHTLPKEVVEEVRRQRRYPEGKWNIEVKKVSYSVTQGEYHLFINGQYLMNFGADKVRGENGEYVFDIPDEDLGRLVVNAFWHGYDDLYHYSDKAKDLFYPKWRENKAS